MCYGLFSSARWRRGSGDSGERCRYLVILREDKRSFTERLEEWMGKFSLGFPVQVFPYTQDELDSPIVAQALREGKVLFERGGRDLP